MTDTSAMYATLAADAVVCDFCALLMEAPTFTLALLDGASQVTVPLDMLDPDTGALSGGGGGKGGTGGVTTNAGGGGTAPGIPGGGSVVFLGEDDTFGTLGTLQAISEGLGTSAPRMSFSVRPPTRTAAAMLNLPANQESRVRLWYGVLDLTTGAVIGVDLLFDGRCDQPRYTGGKRGRAVEFSVTTQWELLFSDAEGQRLGHDFLQSYAPGDNGLEFVVDVERKVPWGADVARPAAVSAVSSGGYGTGTASTGYRGGGGGVGVNIMGVAS